MKTILYYPLLVLVLLLSLAACSYSPWDKTYSGETFEQDLERLQRNDEYSNLDVAQVSIYILEKQWTDKSQLRGKTYRTLLKEAKEHHTDMGNMLAPLFNIGNTIANGISQFMQENPEWIEQTMQSSQRIARQMERTLGNTAQDIEMRRFFQQFDQMTQQAQQQSGDWVKGLQGFFSNAANQLDSAFQSLEPQLDSAFRTMQPRLDSLFQQMDDKMNTRKTQ